MLYLDTEFVKINLVIFIRKNCGIRLYVLKRESGVIEGENTIFVDVQLHKMPINDFKKCQVE